MPKTHPHRAGTTNPMLLRLWSAAVTVVVSAVLATGAAAQAVDWSGGWDSVWRDGGAALYLEQDGNVVTGTYAALDGTLSGEARGRVFTGTWQDAAGAGTFVFAMSPDGETFTGRFGNGEWWNGQRMAQATGLNHGADASSPREAVRTVLQAGNLARANQYDDIAGAVSVLDFDDLDPALSETAVQRLGIAKTLFRVLDGLTFRLWDIPTGGPDREVNLVLGQAGTDVTFPLRLRYGVHPDGTAGWFIVVPPPAEMQETLVRLAAARPGSGEPDDIEAPASPRAAMRQFIEGYAGWIETGDPKPMISTMNLTSITPAARESEAIHMAEYLKGILDRIGRIVWQEISDDPQQATPYQHFVHPRGDIEIAPFPDGDDALVWQFSPSTIASLPDIFVAVEDMPLAAGIVQDAPSTFLRIRQAIRTFDRDLLERHAGVELWQWIVLGVVATVASLLAWIVVALIRRLAAVRERRQPGASSVWAVFPGPLGFIIVAACLLITMKTVFFPTHVGTPLRLAAWMTLVVAGGWLIYRLVDWLGRQAGEPSSRIRSMDELSRSVVVALAKIAVLVGTLLASAEVLDIPWEGVLAGLGIGGIAVALAARSTLENFIGGLTLLADKPVRAGDFCQFGDKVGTVEALGLRSIRIRSLDRTVYTVPNAEFINLYIENFTKRNNILLRTTLQLRYETSPDQMRWILTEIRRLLIRHPKVRPEPARARFVGFGEHSLDVDIFAYVDTSDFNEFLGIREDIFLRIADIVTEAGSSFAFPSSVNYIARDPGLDPERAQQAERAVEAWRRNDRLPFPDFDTNEQWEMVDTLDYPPPGSPDSRQAAARRAERDV